jgi:iron complex outermembrane receptor protein
MTLNYTWNEAEIEENPSNPGQEGNTLSFSPEHKANLGLHYKKPQNYMLSLFCRYLDDQHTNDDNIKYTPEGEKKYMESSFVVDITAKKQFHINRGILKAIDLSLNLDNIFDEEYRTLYIYEDPGRRIYTELAFRF